MKKCSKCYITKDLTEFNKDTRLKCGLKARCKECAKSYDKEYAGRNKLKMSNYQSKYYKENRDKVTTKNKRYRELNKREIQNRQNIYQNMRNRSDPLRRLRLSISNCLRKSLIGKEKYTERSRLYKITGLSYEDLMDHLYSTFERTYNIPREEIILKEVEIDHIIPLATAQCRDDILKLNHYTNIQLLFKQDNQDKAWTFDIDILNSLEP